MLYQKLLFPLLQRVDAERAHDRTLSLLGIAQGYQIGKAALHLAAGKLPQKPVSLFGLSFPNVIGLAAGFDKDVRAVTGLAALGFGHIEVGTLTPRPQMGNPKPRVFRLPPDGAVINRMGFPNGGVQAAVPRLRKVTRSKHDFVIGVSLGKQKETPLTDAHLDYAEVMEAVYPYADYLAVNISSPNTPGLRELQGGHYLGHLLRFLEDRNEQLAAVHRVGKLPLLVKLSPDVTMEEAGTMLDAILRTGVSGIIATNTTLSRAGASHPNRGEQGGLSGTPLRQRSTQLIDYICRQTDGRLPVIGVGGIRSAADVKEKLDAGASLVQIYTGLIYEGPSLVGRILRDL